MISLHRPKLSAFAAGASVSAYVLVASFVSAQAAELSNHLAASDPAASAESIEPAPLLGADGADVNPPLPVADDENAQISEANVVAHPGEELAATPRRFHYAFRLTIRGIYDDNINVSNVDPISDYTIAIEPSIMLGFGDWTDREENYLQFVYAPSVFIYLEHDEADALQHLIRLEGQVRFSRLTLRLGQSVQILDGTNLDVIQGTEPVHDRVNIDVGARTRLNVYDTTLGANYELTGKMFLATQLSASIYDYDTLMSSASILGNVFLNYTYSPKLTAGVGAGGGYSFVDEPSPDQTFEQLLARFEYRPGGKLQLDASGGLEFRQSEETDDSHISPVFDIRLTYTPFDGTAIYADLNRRTSNSAVLVGEDFDSTSIVIGMRQRLFRRFSVGLTGGYQNSNYFSVTDVADTGRDDDHYFFQPTIDVNVTRFWTLGAYYLRRQNSSSDARFSFHDNQVGLRTSLSF